MLLALRKTGIEITRRGVYVVSKAIGSEERTFFHSIEDFLSSKFSKGKVSVALSRDFLFVRKLNLPVQATENLDESLSYSADELFPVGGLVLKGYVISSDGESSSVLVWAMDEEVYEKLSVLKSIKLITPTPFLYPLYFPGTELSRKLGEFTEVNVYKDGKLQDSILRESSEANLPENEFLGAELAIRTLEEGNKPDFYFIDRRIVLNKKAVRLTAALLLLAIAFVGGAYYSLSSLKRDIKSLKEENAKLMPRVDEYNKLLDEIAFKKSLIELAETQRSKVLEVLRDITYLLPKDTWLKSFSYKGNKVSIEGFTSSTTNLLRSLENSGKFSSIKLQGTPRKSDRGELFRIDLELR